MSYDMIDRFLRNNLGDDDYAKYSAALDSLCTPQPQEPEQEPVAYCDIHHLPEPCVQCAKEHEGYNIPPQPKETEQEPTAQCTNSDLWNCKYCKKIKTCKAINDHRNFGNHEETEQEPVAAAKKDEVFAASIEFIGTLTGMTPPPIEVAPPEVFKPFRDFTEKVCSILATSPQRTWVGLTDEEVNNFVKAVWPRDATAEDYIHAIEAKLKEKNT